MTDLIGKIFDDKYRLKGLIGQGGMGDVYEAEHTILKRAFAVKVMQAESAERDDAVERFFREARAASAIGHPNIVEIFDIGREADGTAFIVMELLNGETLDDLIVRQGRLPAKRAAAITLQVLSALSAVHAQGIIHRDLKSPNVFLAIDKRGQEEVKLLDFGIVKVLEGGDESLGLTQSGTVIGTPYYLSPEQARGARDIDQRVDIWSVGVMLYEMLCGVLPFEGETYNEIIGAVLLEEYVPVTQIEPSVPEELGMIVDKSLAKDRDLRFYNAQEMLDALMAIQSGAIDSLSAPAAGALRTSLIPPPAQVAGQGHASGQDQSTPGSTADTVDMEPRESDTIDLDPIIDSSKLGKRETLAASTPLSWDDITPRESKTSRKKIVVALAAGLTAVAIGVAATLYFIQGESAEPSIQPTQPGEATTAAKPAAKEAAGDTAAAQSARPDAVTLELQGLPEGAEVTLDGREIASPVTVSRSDKPAILKIVATGYATHQIAVSLDKDQTLAIEMEQELTPSSGTGPKAGAAKKSKKQKKGSKKVLLDSPFKN